MASMILSVLLNVLIIVGGIFTLYGLYFFVMAFFSFRKQKQAEKAPAKTRFALVIAARNEAAVIGQLVDSLNEQNYPKELYTVFVAPNNCTDNTKEVALAHGAQIFDVEGKISSKGDVLRQVAQYLMDGEKYDAMCVFDADNLIHPEFLQKMNDVYATGVHVAQGFRDSKNPDQTAVSTSYSVCYWMQNSFYNSARQSLKLSSLVNGSGFMMSVDMLKRLGGWNTCTMTEDYEVTAQCVMLGEKVHYVPGAIFYDEQPTTFKQSWKQRRRWTTGTVQGMQLYSLPLIRSAIKKRSWTCMDVALTFLMPITQVISLAISIPSMILGAWRIQTLNIMPISYALGILTGVGVLAYIALAVLAAFVVKMNRRKGLRNYVKGVGYFAVFLASWALIGLISFFKRVKTWDAIAHTCTVSAQDVIKNG